MRTAHLSLPDEKSEPSGNICDPDSSASIANQNYKPLRNHSMARVTGNETVEMANQTIRGGPKRKFGGRPTEINLQDFYCIGKMQVGDRLSHEDNLESS